MPKYNADGGETPLRWERDLDKPEPYRVVYLSESAVKTLRYYLGHLTHPDYDTGAQEDLSLSEALDKLGNEWNTLGNKQLRCDRLHKGKGVSKVIDAYWAHKHRKCSKERCKREDVDRCPVWEW